MGGFSFDAFSVSQKERYIFLIIWPPYDRSEAINEKLANTVSISKVETVSELLIPNIKGAEKEVSWMQWRTKLQREKQEVQIISLWSFLILLVHVSVGYKKDSKRL